MRETLLLNPFNSVPEAAPVRRQLTGTRITAACTTCQSDDIVSHAVIQWSNEAQDWQIADAFNQPAYCNACRSACTIVWRPIN
jgi:hypothetical protein